MHVAVERAALSDSAPLINAGWTFAAVEAMVARLNTFLAAREHHSYDFLLVNEGTDDEVQAARRVMEANAVSTEQIMETLATTSTRVRLFARLRPQPKFTEIGDSMPPARAWQMVEMLLTDWAAAKGKDAPAILAAAGVAHWGTPPDSLALQKT